MGNPSWTRPGLERRAARLACAAAAQLLPRSSKKGLEKNEILNYKTALQPAGFGEKLNIELYDSTAASKVLNAAAAAAFDPPKGFPPPTLDLLWLLAMAKLRRVARLSRVYLVLYLRVCGAVAPMRGSRWGRCRCLGSAERRGRGRCRSLGSAER